MLTPPALAAETIAACLEQHYGMFNAVPTFLPIGADSNTAVYNIDADGLSFFLKLRRDDFDPMAVAVPAWLQAQGNQQIMAPIPTRTEKLWVNAYGFDWVLYPFLDGEDGWTTELSPTQWIALGASLRAVHDTILPAAIQERLPREDFGPRLRQHVRMYDQQVIRQAFGDPSAVALATWWKTRRDEILTIVDRAERLAAVAARQNVSLVLCHTDLHAGNVLLLAHDEIMIVDWDNPLLAPRERDLMFIGGAVGGIWNTALEEELFYQGYGPINVDKGLLSYYRYQRIVADLAAYGEEIFGMQVDGVDREQGVRSVISQWEPGSVVEAAHRIFEQI